MGLGKTLQMLSLCLERPPAWEEEGNKKKNETEKKKKEKVKGTVLVVTPVSVNVEWDAEIEKHTEDMK